MGDLVDTATTLGSRYATEFDEEELIRRKAEELETVFEENFGEVPTLYEFCDELGISKENLDNDIELDAKDFGAAVFCEIAGFPVGLNENQHDVACQKLDLNVEPRHFVVLTDYYRSLL